MKEEADYKLVKKNLRRGDLKELREKFSLSKSTVAKILRGESNNIDFLEAVIDRAKQNKQRRSIAGLKQIDA